MNEAFTDYITNQLPGFINRSRDPQADSPSKEAEFNTLALTLFRLQFDHNAPYARFCNRLGKTPENVDQWRHIPAMPTVGFKELELTSIPPAQRTRVFHSSGTTEQTPSRHFHCPESLTVYNLSLQSAFPPHLLPGLPPNAAGICLTPAPQEAPHSSLIHMFDAVKPTASQPWEFTGYLDTAATWNINSERTLTLFQNSIESSTPCLIMGTAFLFVHLFDHMESKNIRINLPAGSRVMETGGYKGRSRTLPRKELHQLIQDRLGITPDFVVCEYGMSELSSQAYDHVAGRKAPSTENRQFKFPPWARTRVVSPENGEEVDDGQTGLVEIIDLANVASVLAVRTEDLATRCGDRFQLQGRAPTAEPRGCSLMAR